MRMRVLGIDSGSRVTGYGVIESDGADCFFVDCGVIRVNATDPLPVRLKAIHGGVSRVIDEFKPEVVAFEDLFYSVNAQSALKLGHARGVCMHAAAVHDLLIYEYSPAEVKSAVTGYGRAEKPQVQHMVRALLRMPEGAHAYDASDALAVALCHVHTHRFRKATAGGL